MHIELKYEKFEMIRTGAHFSATAELLARIAQTKSGRIIRLPVRK